MGKKGGWFSTVKKALSPQIKKNQNEELSSAPSTEELSSAPSPLLGALPSPSVVSKTTEIDINDQQNKHAYSIALATAAVTVTEAAVAAAQAPTEVLRLTTVPHSVGKSKEEVSAIKIQTAFRGHLARRSLRALRGLVRLKSLIESQSVKRQASTTLRCMQTLARVQSQIRARRIRMSEENLALQRQLHQKHEKELDKLRMGELWDDSQQSKEQIEASLQSKQEEAMRRERALAYSFQHQQPRKSNKYSNLTFMDPNNPQWGWSWLERWMASRPWESRSLTDKERNDHGSVKSYRTLSVAGEINRAYALRDLTINTNKASPTVQRPSRLTTPGSSKRGPGIQKLYRSAQSQTQAQDEDMRSTRSMQSERFRRHSISGSLVRDDESLASSQASPSYLTKTRSAKATINVPSPLSDKKQPSVGSVKKRLSFSASPGVARRHSVPGKLESTPVKDVSVQVLKESV